MLDLETDLWVPYRALALNGMLLDEQVRLEWVLPVLTTRPGEFRDLGLRGERRFPDDLPFAMLEKRWLARRFAAEEVKQGDIFTIVNTEPLSSDGTLQRPWKARGLVVSPRGGWTNELLATPDLYQYMRAGR